jgi:chromosome partitioning protein
MAAAPAGLGDAPAGSADELLLDRTVTGRIVAVANLKGGTGKSTLAVNLACLAAVEHGAALLVDADPQGTAAAWLEASAPEDLPPGLAVEAWPAGDHPAIWAERIFRHARHQTRVVVDMPPQLGPGFETALRLVDALVLPVTPSAIDLRATALTLQRLRRVQQRRDGRPACLLVPNRVDQRTAIGRTIQRALRDLELGVAPPIAQRSSHASAFSARQWIGAHAPGSAAYREMAAVAAEFEKLLRTCPASDYGTDTAALKPAAAVADRAGEPGFAARRAQRQGILATLLAGFRLLGRPQSG